MATVTQFTITKGNPLDFYIIVKENNSLLSLILDVSDTFSYTLINKRTNVKVAEDIVMTIADALNGEIKGTITSLVSATLTTKRSAAEDGYMPRANHRLIINGNTLAQGPFVAAIENVFVIEG